MKKVFIIIISVLWVTSIFSQSEILTKIDFDGVYIEISPHRYIKLTEVPAYDGRFIRQDWANAMYRSLPYVKFTDREDITTVPKVLNIILKGADFTPQNVMYVTVHKAEQLSHNELTYRDYNVNTELNNYWAIKRGQEDYFGFYTCKTKIRKLGDYYYAIKFTENIEPNQVYIIWLNNKFWLFKTKSGTNYTSTRKIVKYPIYFGAYIKLTNSTYVSLDTVQCNRGQYIPYGFREGKYFYNKDGYSINPNLGKYTYNFLEVDKLKQAYPINRLYFDGIILKGYYDINNLTIYKLDTTLVSSKNKNALYKLNFNRYYREDSGFVSLLKNSNKITFQKATKQGYYYIKPDTVLSSGIYAIYDKPYCWIFKIK